MSSLPVRIAALLAVALGAVACDQTPAYFPPCVDPSAPCSVDASDGAAFDVSVNDATGGPSDAGSADVATDVLSTPGEAGEGGGADGGGD